MSIVMQQIRGMLAAPLQTEDRVIGLIYLDSPHLIREFSREDLNLLLDVANGIEGHTICAFGDASAWPVQSFLKHYRHEFEYMIDHGGRSLVSDAMGAQAA